MTKDIETSMQDYFTAHPNLRFVFFGGSLLISTKSFPSVRCSTLNTAGSLKRSQPGRGPPPHPKGGIRRVSASRIPQPSVSRPAFPCSSLVALAVTAP